MINPMSLHSLTIKQLHVKRKILIIPRDNFHQLHALLKTNQTHNFSDRKYFRWKASSQLYQGLYAGWSLEGDAMHSL